MLEPIPLFLLWVWIQVKWRVCLFSDSGIDIFQSGNGLSLTDLFYTDFEGGCRAIWLSHCLKVVCREFLSALCGYWDPIPDKSPPPDGLNSAPSSLPKIYKLFLCPDYEKCIHGRARDIHRVC